MAYEKQTWVCGDVITADKLNHIEEGIEDCCGGGDCGYKCEEGYVSVFDDTVTTEFYYGDVVAFLSYRNPIQGDDVKVVFDGVEYTLPKSPNTKYGNVLYGELENDTLSFDNYPLAIGTGAGGNALYTEVAGTYDLNIMALSETITVSECFEKAVKLFTLKNVADAENGSVVANDVNNNIASGERSFAEGNQTTASGSYSHAEGYGAMANGQGCHAEGQYTIASSYYSHAEGNRTEATNYNAHAEGFITEASGETSHAEGYDTTASGDYSHAEGNGSVASGLDSHAEGRATTASGVNAHAEGNGSVASKESSHAEGNQTTASGNYSHAEGSGSVASGEASHAEGQSVTASGNYSHAQNNNTIAQGKDQTVIGRYNIAQGTNGSSATTDYAFIVGNGNTDNSRSNAFAIKWDGTFVFANGTEITPAQFASLLALLS